jgi:hypothetical protein
MSTVYSPKQGIIKADLAILPEQFDAVCEEIVDQVADLIVGYAKIFVNVDTGSLRDSIRKESGGEGLHYRLKRVRAGGYVTNPKTGKLVDYAAPVEAKYPFMRPALEEAQPEALLLAQSQFAKVLGDAGTVSIEGNDLVIGIKADFDPTYSDLRKLEVILMRNISLLRRFTGDENIDRAIATILRLIMALRMLQTAANAFTIATGPLGWAYFATTAVSSAFFALDPILEMGAR